RGEETRLGDVGLFGLALGTAEFGIEAGQFFRALLPPPLPRFLWALKLLPPLHTRGNVGGWRVAAAARHGVGTPLHHQIALIKTLQKRLAACDVTGKPFAHERSGGVFVRSAPFGVEVQDVVEACANPSELRRQREDLAELAIPTDEVQLL